MKINFNQAKAFVVLVFMTVLLQGGCSYQRPYPESWPPLREFHATDCWHITGIYNDRGEMVDSSAHPSLTNELFGYHSGWEDATQVEFSLTNSTTLQVTIQGSKGELFRRTLSAEEKQFACDAGRIIIKDTRSVVTEASAGIESVIIELVPIADYLVIHTQEDVLGTVLVIIPIAGSSSSWYRFKRLSD